MEPDQWTPARGWAIALGRAGLRSAVLLAVFTGVLYLVWPMDEYLPPHWSIIALVFLVSAVVGYPTGHMVVSKLLDACGLAGRSILLPVLMLQVAGSVLAYHLALLLRGAGGMCTFVLAAGMAFWSVAAGFRTLLLD